jgi:hypothetical protein
MTTRTEVLSNGAIGCEEPLCLTRRFKPLHSSLPLPGGLMRVLRTIIEIPMLAMFDPQKDFSLSGPVALQFVGDDDP